MRRQRVSAIVATVLAALMTAGCSTPAQGPRYEEGPEGSWFMHTRIPLTRDLHDTPVVADSGRGRIIHVEEPFSGTGMYAELNTNAVGDVAARYGLRKVYWADLEIFNFLGIRRERRIHLYGVPRVVDQENPE